MDIKIIGDAGQEVQPATKQIQNPTGLEGGLPGELEQKAIGQVLGLENPSDLGKYTDNLKTLIQYAKSQTDDHSPESLKWVVRSLELKLNTPPFLEDKVKYIARYAWLLTEEKRLSSERQKFEAR